MFDETSDVVIVGSGPAGSAYARIIREGWPDARILMIDSGPRLSGSIGGHMDNEKLSVDAMSNMKTLSQGPYRTAYDRITREEWDARCAGDFDASLLRRPGLYIANRTQKSESAFFAGFSTAAVGGMANYWAAGCPRPSLSERPSCLDPRRMEDALEVAERLLGVNKNPFPGDCAARQLQSVLGAVFDHGRSPDRYVQPMPLACSREDAGGVRWHGTGIVLGPMTAEPSELFEIRDNTVCRRILHQDGRVSGVELVRAGEDRVHRVAAGSVVVAGNSLHSPQLLHASGIRLPALGRFINDHHQIVQLAQVRFDTPLESMVWIPHRDGEWPYSVTLLPGRSEFEPFTVKDEWQSVVVIVFCASELRYESRITFDESQKDWLGLPAISIDAPPTHADRLRMDSAKSLAHRIAGMAGRPTPGCAPAVLPVGSSLHYQGTMRMGLENDGNSVCDPQSRVFGFENLYVAGNGVIPTMTATNPTLFSVALATIGAQRIASERSSAF